MIDHSADCFRMISQWHNATSAIWFMTSELSSVWEWYVMKYIRLMFSWQKRSHHRSAVNFLLWLNNMTHSKPQFNKNNWFRRCMTYCSAVRVFCSGINVTVLLNLSVTEKIVSRLSDRDKSGRVNTKLMIIIWNDHEDVRIDCNDLYEWCWGVCISWHWKQWQIYSYRHFNKSERYRLSVSLLCVQVYSECLMELWARANTSPYRYENIQRQ